MDLRIAVSESKGAEYLGQEGSSVQPLPESFAMTRTRSTRVGLHPRPIFLRFFRLLPVVFVTVALIAMAGCSGSNVRLRSAVFFPAAPDTARIQFLDRVYDSSTIAKSSRLQKLLMGEQPSMRLGKPYGVAVMGSRIYMADTQFTGLIRMDLAEKNMVLLPGISGLAFRKPLNLDAPGDGRLYIADVDLGRIVVMDAEENMLRVYGEGSLAPLDIDVGEDYFYIVDKSRRNVVMMDPVSGEIVGSFDATPDSAGGFSFPTNVAQAPSGEVYVTDTLQCRIYRFNAEGEYIGAFGGQGNVPGLFVRPKGIEVDRRGNVYVVDSAFENVQILSPDGLPLGFIGGPGRSPGRMFLPAGISISAEGVDEFEDLAHKGVEVDELILVTSQFGPAHLDIFGSVSNVEEFARRFPPTMAYQEVDSLALRQSVPSLEDINDDEEQLP
jgi:hypothetical protein